MFMRQTGKDKTSRHCERLCNALNISMAKFCLKKKDFPSCFKYYKIKKCLNDLPSEAFFVYDENVNSIKVRIDAIDWGNFFRKGDYVNI